MKNFIGQAEMKKCNKISRKNGVLSIFFSTIIMWWLCEGFLEDSSLHKLVLVHVISTINSSWFEIWKLKSKMLTIYFND